MNEVGSEPRQNEFYFRNISVAELRLTFNKIKSDAIGYDGIPLKLMKIIFPYIENVLLHIINSILTFSVFPDCWKIARIVPIKKHGTSTDFSNMRPISVLPMLSKIAETIMKEQVVQYLNEFSLIDDCQAAYRKGYNTTSLLLSLTDCIRQSVGRNNFCILLSLDSSKAFNSISANILNNKLFTQFNFSSSACKLISSYLTDRKQYVHCGDQVSQILDVSSGVPQGSVLGPILFMAYVNDFVSCLNTSICKPYIFADDMQILFFGNLSTIASDEALINQCLRNVQSWTESNALQLNSSKTKAMLFTSQRSPLFTINLYLQNEAIEFVPKLKCLGITLDNRLTFESHINNLHCNINFTLHRLYSLNLYVPLQVRLKIAHALLLSKLMYGLEVFSGTLSTHLNDIKILFNRVARYVYNIPPYEHISEHTKQLLGCPVDQFIKFRVLFFFYKTIFTQTPVSLAQQFRFTRILRNQQICIPWIDSCLFERSFHVRVARFWNMFPTEYRNSSVTPSIFKRRLKNYLAVNIS